MPTSREPFTFEVAGIVYGVTIDLPEGWNARIDHGADPGDLKEERRDAAVLEPIVSVYDARWRLRKRVKMRQVGMSQPEREPEEADNGADYDPQ